MLSPHSPLFPLPLKTFECICFVHISKSDQSKLDSKALKCIFLSYGVDQKGYKCYHPPTRRKFVSKDVTFFESLPFFSLSRTFLQGENLIGEELSLVPLPVPVPIFHFDGDGGKGENDGNRQSKEVIHYSRRKK